MSAEVHEQDEEERDDRVIAAALRWSLLGMAVVAGLAVATFVVTNRPRSVVLVPPTPAALPAAPAAASWLTTALRCDASYVPAHEALASYYASEGDHERAARHRLAAQPRAVPPAEKRDE